MSQVAVRMLMVEDNASDARLILAELRHCGFDITSRRVETEADYLEQLDTAPDIILSDYNLPAFDGLHALALLRGRGLDTPFILISGTIGEELAVAAIKLGATDYLLKDRLGRLGEAVRRALEDHQAARERRLAEQALDQSNRRLSLVMETSPLAIVMLDSADKTVIWNRAAERMFGWAEAEVLGQPAPVLDPQYVLQARTDSPQSAARSLPHVEETSAKDNKKLICRWFNTPLFDGERGFAGLLCMAQDLTEQRSLEEQLQQAQKMEAVGNLAGGIAHDFNNLLTVINGYALIMQGELPTDNPMQECVREISLAGNRAASLTRQLLAFSRKQILDPKVLDLNAIVADTAKMLGRLIGEDVDLKTSLAPDLGRMKADPGQMEQILINVAVNARDAMPHGGTLVITTTNVDLDGTSAMAGTDVRTGRYVVLTVSDTGHGMDAVTRTRIFEPFFTTKEVGKGTGLGLATVYGIVKQSDGHIVFDSEVGRGTTFTFYFPRVDQAMSTPVGRVPDRPSSGTETVLLCEDEQGVRGLMRQILQRHGYAVLEVNSGDQALQVAANHHGPIHVLLTDVVMPGMSGRQLAETLATTRPDTKVVYVSGYTDDTVFRHGVLRAEMTFVRKPFTPATLLAKVREVLSQPE